MIIIHGLKIIQKKQIEPIILNEMLNNGTTLYNDEFLEKFVN